MHLILASSSPRRQALLRQVGYHFDVVEPSVEERPRAGESPERYVIRNAREKAAWVAHRTPAPAAATILAADTIVVQDGLILEKPGDPAHACTMLRRLAGRRHQVWTGVCLRGAAETCFAVRTAVCFHPLTEAQIEAYVATGEPMGKAGAYAIQGLGAALVDHLEGSYSNVVGLPLERVQAVLGPPSGPLPHRE